MDNLYPDGPSNVPVELTKPTSTYKQRAWLAVLSLATFITVYIALAGWFCWTAYAMFTQAQVGGDDAVFRVFIGGCAAFLAVFMLKALFFVKRGGNTGAVQVTAEEQPTLFEFLYRLADEAGAPRPKKVFLSPRVNAAVFYDLSLINLIFPSRKNLEIGLSLVNVLTLSEFKAVLAHEFGHFAQRSMAIGSWVYIAQQIAAQVVAKRDALDKLLRVLSRIDIRIAWIGWLLSLIVWSVRCLMDTFLSLVVLAQRALSRQMEFQADLVAVSLTGSDELVHALHKLQAADDAWDRTLRFASSEIAQGRLPHDFFEVQRKVIDKVGSILDDETYGKVPRAREDNPAEHRVFSRSFAQPPQMWSTHPANADREENAKRHYLAATHDERSAWLLFKDEDATKVKVITQLVGTVKAELAEPEVTLHELEKSFALLQYKPRYRGAYLGRALARHVANAEELVGDVLSQEEVRHALSDLYSADLADDLVRLRDLEEERGTLIALKDKVYQTDGGRIVHRGREISRRDLPAAINEVSVEEEAVRKTIWAHDRRCRSAHLAAAEQIGNGYKPYFVGLINVLHYAEHSLADVRDAHGLLGNVFAVVMADGKVSSRELNRLIDAANTLQGVLARVYRQKAEVQLDQSLCQRLKIASWAESLEEFKLPPASRQNINDWMGAVDGWVGSLSAALAELLSEALEQLLHTEDQLADALEKGTSLAAAPSASQVPEQYKTLLPGQERKRQKRLGLWDRFQTADGPVAAVARFITAILIVGSVLGFSSVMGTSSDITVYNGLGQAVRVKIDDTILDVAPFSSRDIALRHSRKMIVETRIATGHLVETFEPSLTRRGYHYIYNVAGAVPLVEWTASYGSAKEVPPRLLGAPRWTTSSADILFDEPPESVQTKASGSTRTVLSAFTDAPPAEILEVVASPSERDRIISAHVKWDSHDTPYAHEWQQLMDK